MKYLYGASVQGIQSYIFKTNELRDIAGASELVEQACTTLFLKTLGKQNDKTWIQENQIIAAAGNVKYTLNEAECREAVLNFPKAVMCMAPGITISQAVVKIEGNFKAAINELEKKLHEARNQQASPMTFGLLGMRRAPRTGLPAVTYDNDGRAIDEATSAKRKHFNLKTLCKKSFGTSTEHRDIAYDIKDMTCDNDWIAIIHADGNGLGRVVQEVGGDPEKYSRFSQHLDEATWRSAQEAFNTIDASPGNNKCIPIRPVVLGGDDMTTIIRGSLAIDYIKTYLTEFEKNTKSLLKDYLPAGMNCLSACAGVAFIKSSYPFYYGYNLAEELCGQAKKLSDRAFSCIMFHKVQDSFVTSYDDIVRRELSIDGKPMLKYGPYSLEPKGEWLTINALQHICQKLEDPANQGIKTGIRRWLTALHEGRGNAGQMLSRMKAIHDNKELINTLTNQRHMDNAVAAADILSIYTIINQKTR